MTPHNVMRPQRLCHTVEALRMYALGRGRGALSPKFARDRAHQLRRLPSSAHMIVIMTYYPRFKTEQLRVTRTIVLSRKRQQQAHCEWARRRQCSPQPCSSNGATIAALSLASYCRDGQRRGCPSLSQCRLPQVEVAGRQVVAERGAAQERGV